MALAGTIRNGQVQLDRPADLPDGTRVTLWPEGDDHFLPPLPNETYAQYIAGLRESIAETEAGIPGLTIEEVMSRLDAELFAFESVAKE